ncbi:hypothetical protein HYW75_03150 [Candidatus Pacearchaeota archaeon]|nr:hypothetical protein [Candidatus Pacearchaeota archaeon]
MTSIEEHIKKIKEHLGGIEDSINQGIEKKPVTIGFHCSACALQYLELYLHITKKIPIGKVIKHEWFKRPKPGQKKELLIERKLSVNFEKKQELYELLYTLEEERNSLMYGKATKEQIKIVIDTFQKFKEMIGGLLQHEDHEI